MKKLVFFFLATMLLGACADDVIYQNSVSKTSKNQMFSYDSVTNPEVWKTFMSFEDMMEATQIPENILKEIPTDTLVALCMNHPLAGVYTFYNNHLEGASIIMDHFNGFQELKRRQDAGEKIIDFYENLNIDYNIGEMTRNPYSCHFTEITPFQVGFSELVVASKKIEDVYSDKNIVRLERVVNEKYEEKLRNKKYNNISALGHSLLIGAQLKMQKSGPVKQLNQFIEKGGDINNPNELKEISRIIYTK